MTAVVRLRPVEDRDLPVLYEHQRDADAASLADVPSREWDAFVAHWARIRADPANETRVVDVDGEVAGNVLSFVRDGRREIGYWLGREFWGRGLATAAVQALLDEISERPLYGYVARRNAASRRVLEKCGFTVDHEEDDGVMLVLRDR